MDDTTNTNSEQQDYEANQYFSIQKLNEELHKLRHTLNEQIFPDYRQPAKGRNLARRQPLNRKKFEQYMQQGRQQRSYAVAKNTEMASETAVDWHTLAFSRALNNYQNGSGSTSRGIYSYQ